ncbi:hypothetical protein CDIK_4344 [Cucumispora dikerogammari]|nr:hypothetical protein CDIK_4344 [Cucumispora dikerogammari]
MFEALNITFPCETSLRSKVEELANKKRETMKNILKDRNFIFIFDERLFNNKKFVNIIASSFSEPNNKLLIKCIKIFESSNYTLSCQIIDDTIKEYNLTRKCFKLLISDAASYMIKAVQSLKVFYKNMLHITCISHLYHNCAMKIRNAFTDVDFLISSMKALVIKNVKKQKLFKEFKQIPKPVVTR